MAIINIENSFITENRSVYTFMSQTGQGLYIPLYQREYSWDSDNIEQLLEDMAKGIERIARGDEEKEIRFLGTIITVIEANRNNIYPKDPQAVPSRIEKLIDGQQRLSTIAILAGLLTKQLAETQKKIKANSPIKDKVDEICSLWNQKLINVFSFDLGRGNPSRKPKIIRGNQDYWTRDGSVDNAYKSPLANYLGSVIESIFTNKEYPKASKDKHGKILHQNITAIDRWLKNVVTKAHELKSDDFTPAWKIIENFSQESIWDYDKDDLVEIIKQKDFSSNKTDSYILCELVQLLAVCHYLLDRCCFTIIQPTDDDWAFDMFQSLNATGTPLTAIETFKPTVSNETDQNGGFKESENEKSFRKIEELFIDATTAQQKSKMTNDFLTSFFVSYNGQSVSSHFSYQRRTLIDSYSVRGDFQSKSAFIKYLGDYADFYKNVWLNCDQNKLQILDAIKSSAEADLATMLIQFLKVSSHKMAITVLGAFYKDVINGVPNSISNFIDATKAVTAFYLLWRSSHSNAGLDTVYREFFKSEDKNWKYENAVIVSELKTHFWNALKSKSIGDKSSWTARAMKRLNYEDAGVSICKLLLLVSFHDTIVDDRQASLMKVARDNTSKYLCLERWNSSDLKTVEHIAPQTNNGEWSIGLYEQNNEIIHSIGNLTLLPQELNASASNKGWKEKYLYYRCLGETDNTKVQEIGNLAKSLGVELKESTINLLKISKYGEHIKPLVAVDEHLEWNAELVRKRNERILEIVWDRISKWL